MADPGAKKTEDVTTTTSKNTNHNDKEQQSLVWYHDLKWSKNKPAGPGGVEVEILQSDQQKISLNIPDLGKLRELINELENAI